MREGLFYVRFYSMFPKGISQRNCYFSKLDSVFVQSLDFRKFDSKILTVLVFNSHNGY